MHSDALHIHDFINKDSHALKLKEQVSTTSQARILVQGLSGSRDSFFIFSSFKQCNKDFIIVANDKEDAAYLLNDLEQFSTNAEVSFFPDSFRRVRYFEELDTFQVQQRIEALNQIHKPQPHIIVTYPEALFEKIISKKILDASRLDFEVEHLLDIDEMIDKLVQYGFERVDFVYEPGQFSIRGGIIDLFSYAADYPYRIELNDIVIESIRSFDTESQLSIRNIGKFTLLPNVSADTDDTEKFNFLEILPEDTVVWIKDIAALHDSVQKCFEDAERFAEKMIHYEEERSVKMIRERAFVYPHELMSSLLNFHNIFFHTKPDIKEQLTEININARPQPSFNKNFQLLIADLKLLEEEGFQTFIFTNSASQIERFYNIFDDLKAEVKYIAEIKSFREGFIDDDMKIACYTDHQIFARFHGYKIKQAYSKDQAFTLKTLRELHPGDYVTHIDHGVGRYAGLEKITVGGQSQEAIRLIYRNDDILYVSINSLHKIAKFVGQEGSEPVLHKLGSDTWKILKAKTKQKVKDIAGELIKLYAKRRASKGYAFSPDNYLQAELEASFIYEDTPDQSKSTLDVKADMEKDYPMDRLICGDVGFGKTEVAIRAAFKATQDGKQVAILVPTTILALQHYRTLKERFKEFPIDVDYISRFRTTKEKTAIQKRMKDGSLEIVIGTHGLLSKKTEFKDLGLLIIDEEQKFGVSSKEKLRELKVNVDTLTLTATPIPRTLQFSLMAARDLSVINTPPPNRQPIHTERRVFNDDLIRESILHEVYRGGQVFFVHNRVKNLAEIALMIQKLCPTVEVGIAHGQLEADRLEEILLGFIDHKFDVLVCTNIIETGLDIPNANTIIINNAHQFGLSDLHQLRGRVGRSNRKAYCYLFAPPSSVLTLDARKRLKTIEEFSDLGSGFNVAMRDLDIRGAGNLLGGEQSGFIADIGYETYQKILEEAIIELKETEFKDVFESPTKEKNYVRDVTVDSDVEMLIPDSYVVNIQERLSLYQQLDKIQNEDGINKFTTELKDRFGDPPSPILELFNGLRARWIASKLGIERIILKKKKMQCYFISNPSAAFYETALFHDILKFVATYQEGKAFSMKQSNQSLILIREDVKTLLHVQKLLQVIYDECVK